ALSSFLVCLRRLGGLLLALLSSILLQSLRNQNGVRTCNARVRLVKSIHGFGTARTVQRRCDGKPWLPENIYKEEKNIGRQCKRPRCEDFSLTLDRVPLNPRPAKKGRCGRRKAWRFFLPSSVDLVGDESLLPMVAWRAQIPSSVDLVGDESLLSMVGEAGINNKYYGDFMADQFGGKGRDFAAEAVEVRSLHILRPHASSSEPLNGPTEVPAGGSPQFRDFRSSQDWVVGSKFDSPIISGTRDLRRFDKTHRDYPPPNPLFVNSPCPHRHPTPMRTGTLRGGLELDLAALYILSPPKPMSISFDCFWFGGRPVTSAFSILSSAWRTDPGAVQNGPCCERPSSAIFPGRGAIDPVPSLSHSFGTAVYYRSRYDYGAA
ncbi:unnamed protein product, partial [Linum tenue]